MSFRLLGHSRMTLNDVMALNFVLFQWNW